HLGLESFHIRATCGIPTETNSIRTGFQGDLRTVGASETGKHFRSENAIVDCESVTASVRLEECDLHYRLLLRIGLEQQIVTSANARRKRVRGRDDLIWGEM
ncbi:hypothetical protein PFISCL1PPCAC_3099, partial [Pristionchus fissidentatus]